MAIQTLATDFPYDPAKGAAIPGTTECEVDALKPYHPPCGEEARDYIAEFSSMDGGLKAASSSRFRMPGAFKLEDRGGWPTESARLMASLTFNATYGPSGLYFYATGGGDRNIDGYLLVNWQIYFERKGETVEFADILNWKAPNGQIVITKWFWNHYI